MSIERLGLTSGENTMYCYPTGICDLGSLSNGFAAAMLFGEKVSADSSGYSVRGAGDINGDGVDDVLIGAPGLGQIIVGETYVLFGSAEGDAWGDGILNPAIIDGQRGFVLLGENAGDCTGWSVSTAGDINGDGLSDIVIGAPFAYVSGRGSYAGKSYVIFGSNQTNAWGNGTVALASLLDGQRGFALLGENYDDCSGYSVSTAGDINGDGLSDILIGAPYVYASPGYDAGSSYVIFGSRQSNAWGNGTLALSSLIDSQRGFVLLGEKGGDRSGYSVSTAGDVNGDGLSDIVIGAQVADVFDQDYAGKSYVIFGSNQATAWGAGTVALASLLDGQRSFVLLGENAGDQSGYSVSTAGDINGDGVSDIVIGAPYADTPSHNAGKSYVIFGSNQTNAWGNGTVSLTSLVDGQRGFVLLGKKANDDTGWSVSTAGDINADGLSDILMGAPCYDCPSNSYVIFGSNQTNAWGNGTIALSSLTDGQRGFVLLGDYGDGRSGYSVSMAGDVNGDEITDIVVGAPNGQAGAGTTYAVFGSNQVGVWDTGVLSLVNLTNGQQGFRFQGLSISDHSGWFVNTAGDINGDGLTDFLLGAPGMTPTAQQIHAGASYIVFGSNQSYAWGEDGTIDLNQIADGQRGVVLLGESLADQSGFSLSTAGDVNGDALSDIMIGAPYAANQAGKTYVIFGSNQAAFWNNGKISLSSLMDGQRGFVLLGENAGDCTGWSVGTAGDINGDDLSEIVIGAPCANISGLDHAGKSHVIFGSRQSNAWGNGTISLTSLTDSQRGFVLFGENYYDSSGYSVSTAGDINGDGFSDIMIGAPYAANQVGKTYVIFGSNQTGAWGNGTLALSSLMDGQRGFVLLGSNNYARSGWSVSSAGDINGDSLADIAIGAPNDAGKSYVIFASNQTNAWGNGTIALSSLVDGQRGFVLLGESSGDQSGWFVSTAGDFNGDTVDDIFLETSYRSHYVVFGSQQVNAWGNGTLTLSNVTDGERGFVLQGSGGSGSSGGSRKVIATAGDVNGDKLADLMVGSSHENFPPGGQITWNSYLVFGQTTIQVYSIELVINQGQTLVVDNQYINVTSNALTSFVVSNVTYGQFEWVVQPGIAIQNFTQANVWNREVQFVQDGSSMPPAYWLETSPPGLTYLPVQPANITFYRRPTTLVQDPLSVHQGQSLIFNSTQLTVSTEDYPPDQVNFTISDALFGQFQLLPSNQSITVFTQEALMAGNIIFTQDGSANAPSYQVSVNDPYFTLPPAPAEVDFYRQPVFLSNQLTIARNTTALITSSELNVQDDYEDALVWFTVQTENGQFEWIPNGNITISYFSQYQIKANQIQFRHNGSIDAPGYNVTVSDNYFTVGPTPAVINYQFVPFPPVVAHPLSDQIFDLNQVIKFTVPFSTFVDPNNYTFVLSAALVDGTSWPESVELSNSTEGLTFKGLVSAESDWNISVSATNTAQLSTATYFRLEVVGTEPDAIDTKTLASILGSLGGVLLTLLTYLYKRHRDQGKREFENPFADAVHAKLDLTYDDFFCREGERYAIAVTRMVEILKQKNVVDIRALSDSRNTPENRVLFLHYADVFAQAIREKVKMADVYCGLSKELRLSELEEQLEQIVDRITELSKGPVRVPQSCCSRFFAPCYPKSARRVAESKASIPLEDDYVLLDPAPAPTGSSISS